jgi:hypothetical protein
MNSPVDLQHLLSGTDRRQRLAHFALLCLGVVEALARGCVQASDAIPLFFHADNCLFVRQHLRRADRVMGHGVQLPDLFEALPLEEAQCEYQRELDFMRASCLQLLEEARVADAPPPPVAP